MISSEIAGLAISIVSGALKVGRKLDEIQAEEIALRDAVPSGFPTIKLNPSDSQLRAALGRLLKEAKKEVDAGRPDPLGAAERAEIEALRQQSGVTDQLFAKCAKHQLLDSIRTRSFKPDKTFRDDLLARSAAWNLDEEDVRNYTYFVAAGQDLRSQSLGFRLGATLLDVLSEVAATNLRFVIGHEPTRRVVENVLTRFSKPELDQMKGWGELLRHALKATLNAALDEREALADGVEWVERALSAVARARDLSTKGDDFVLGIVKGRGLNELLRGALTEGADYLSQDDAEVWEEIVADVLQRAAEKAEGARSFETFFQDNWHSLVGAGLLSLEEHGPKLLDEDQAILKETLGAAVGALAQAFEQGPPNKETLPSVIQAAIATFADPALLEPAVREPWLRDLIASVARTINSGELRAAFSQPALEQYARDALAVFAKYPDVLAEDNELVQAVLSGVLGKMATAKTFAVGPLADAAVEGALTAIAANPGLIDFEYPTVAGDLAAGLAERVAEGGILALQAEAILDEVLDVVATNDELFLAARDGVAKVVVDAVLDASEEDDRKLLAGAALVATLRRALGAVARHGLGLPKNLAGVGDRLKDAVAGGLAAASKAIGKGISQEEVPAVVTDLVERFAKGEKIPEPGSAEFKELFEEILEKVAA